MLHWGDMFEISAWNYDTSAYKQTIFFVILNLLSWEGHSHTLWTTDALDMIPWGTSCRKFLASSIKPKLRNLRFSQKYFILISFLLVYYTVSTENTYWGFEVFPVPSCPRMYETVSCKAWGMVLSLEDIGSALTIVRLPCSSLGSFP